MASIASTSANQVNSLVEMLYMTPEKYYTQDSLHLLAIVHLNTEGNDFARGTKKLMLAVSLSIFSINQSENDVCISCELFELHSNIWIAFKYIYRPQLSLEGIMVNK